MSRGILPLTGGSSNRAADQSLNWFKLNIGMGAASGLRRGNSQRTAADNEPCLARWSNCEHGAHHHQFGAKQ
jgi:hypothetical protein